MRSPLRELPPYPPCEGEVLKKIAAIVVLYPNTRK